MKLGGTVHGSTGSIASTIPETSFGAKFCLQTFSTRLTGFQNSHQPIQNSPPPPLSSTTNLSRLLFPHSSTMPEATDKAIPWVERYRPKNLQEVSHQSEVVSTLQNAVETGRLPHLLLYGYVKRRFIRLNDLSPPNPLESQPSRYW